MKNNDEMLKDFVHVDTENKTITIHSVEDNFTMSFIFTQLFIVEAITRRETGNSKFEDLLTLSNISFILEKLGFNHEFVQKR